jgi:16S rRNA (guanine527-N7)-methyltransferase
MKCEEHAMVWSHATIELIRRTADEWQIDLPPDALGQFAAYVDALLAANAQHNLTRITEPHDIAVRHILDALRCAMSWHAAPRRLADIGSGAGVPGLILAIIQPTCQVTLIESIGKRAEFLRQVSAHLGLSNVNVSSVRAELLGRDPHHREGYDIVTARAVAELRILVEYALPLCRIGGQVLAPKGADVAAELEQARRAIDVLGGGQVRCEPVLLPGLAPRTLVTVTRIAACPAQYPRRPGVPQQRPIGASAPTRATGGPSDAS